MIIRRFAIAIIMAGSASCLSAQSAQSAVSHASDYDGDKAYKVGCSAAAMAGAHVCDELSGNHNFNQSGRKNDLPYKKESPPAPKIETNNHDSKVDNTPR